MVTAVDDLARIKCDDRLEARWDDLLWRQTWGKMRRFTTDSLAVYLSVQKLERLLKLIHIHKTYH